MAAEIETSSQVLKIAMLNGDFRRNYGALLGALLYSRDLRRVWAPRT
jgi:hypothetical protein